MAKKKVIKVDPERGREWLRNHEPERKKMDPKIRDEIAVALGVAAVYLIVHKKRDAKLAVLTALGAATALWVVRHWENAEDR